jgi:hypothetical protein
VEDKPVRLYSRPDNVMSPPEWFRNRRMLSFGTPAARPSLA